MVQPLWVWGIAGLLLFAGAACGEEYTIDPVHSSVWFRVKHLNIAYTLGRFDRFSGEFQFDPDQVAASKARAVIETASINTGSDARDTHLRSPDFFDAVQFPRMVFESDKVRPGDGGRFELVGHLEIHGVTRPVTLDTKFHAIAKGRQDEQRAGFSARTTLDRKAFGIAPDVPNASISDEVEVMIEIEGIAKPVRPPASKR